MSAASSPLTQTAAAAGAAASSSRDLPFDVHIEQVEGAGSQTFSACQLKRWPLAMFVSDGTVRLIGEDYTNRTFGHNSIIHTSPGKTVPHAMVDQNILAGVVSSTPKPKRLDALMCEAFHGKHNPKVQREVPRHLDGSIANTRPDNLEWEAKTNEMIVAAASKRKALLEKKAAVLERVIADGGVDPDIEAVTSSDASDDEEEKRPSAPPAKKQKMSATPAAILPPLVRLTWADGGDPEGAVFQMDSKGDIVASFRNVHEAGQLIKMRSATSGDRRLYGAAIARVLDYIPCQALGSPWVSLKGLTAMHMVLPPPPASASDSSSDSDSE